MTFVLCCNLVTNSRVLFISAFQVQQRQSSSSSTLIKLVSGGRRRSRNYHHGTTSSALGVAAASDWTSSSSANKNNNNNNSNADNNASSSSVLDPLIVCGPSGVGKGTIIERFMSSSSSSFAGNSLFGFSTSHTTRQPRPGEIDGVHYNFVSDKKEMKRYIEMGKFLEHAEVHGNFYGTSWDSLWKVQEEGKRCLLDIDVQGVKRVKALEHTSNELSLSSSSSSILSFGEQGGTTTDSSSQQQPTTAPPNQQQQQQQFFKPKYIFIAPPSLELLEKRLIGRGTESPESLQRRTQNAKEEVEYGLQEGVFDYVLVNDDLEKACKEFEQVVKDLYGL